MMAFLISTELSLYAAKQLAETCRICPVRQRQGSLHAIKKQQQVPSQLLTPLRRKLPNRLPGNLANAVREIIDFLDFLKAHIQDVDAAQTQNESRRFASFFLIIAQPTFADQFHPDNPFACGVNLLQ